MEECTIIKCGGSTLETLPFSFFQAIADLHRQGKSIIIVHGGGPAINGLLEKLEIPTQFIDGLRYTCEETMKVVEMVLGGQTNKQIVRKLKQAGADAWGLTGVDGGLIEAKRTDKPLGLVGDITRVRGAMIRSVLAEGFIPVISPIGVSADFTQRFNINADVAAGAIASAVGAKRLLLITDVPGIMQEDVNGEKKVISDATPEKIGKLILDGVIYGGMIPKVQSALDALGQGVPQVIICQGTIEELNGVFAGKEVGTSITA